MAGTQAVVIPISDKTEMRRYAPIRKVWRRQAEQFYRPEVVISCALSVIELKICLQSAKGRDWKFPYSRGRRLLSIPQPAKSRSRNWRRRLRSQSLSNRTRFCGASSRWERWVAWPSGWRWRGSWWRSAASARRTAATSTGCRWSGGGGPAVPSGPASISTTCRKIANYFDSDVKVGDTIIVSSTQGADPSRLTAISLISGADTCSRCLLHARRLDKHLILPRAWVAAAFLRHRLAL